MKAELSIAVLATVIPVAGGSISGDSRMFVFAGTGVALLAAVLFYKEHNRKAREEDGKAKISQIGSFQVGFSLVMMFCGGVSAPLFLGMDAMGWVPRPAADDFFAMCVHWSLSGLLLSFFIGGLLEGLVMRLYRRGKSSSAVLVDRLADRLHLPGTDSTDSVRQAVEMTPEQIEQFFNSLTPEQRARIAEKQQQRKSNSP